MYRGDYIYYVTLGPKDLNRFPDPTPSNYFVVCVYISAFAYLLTYSQLGSLSSTTAGGPQDGTCSPAGWDNPPPIPLTIPILPLSGETFGADLVGLHVG